MNFSSKKTSNTIPHFFLITRKGRVHRKSTTFWPSPTTQPDLKAPRSYLVTNPHGPSPPQPLPSLARSKSHFGIYSAVNSNLTPALPIRSSPLPSMPIAKVCPPQFCQLYLSFQSRHSSTLHPLVPPSSPPILATPQRPPSHFEGTRSTRHGHGHAPWYSCSSFLSFPLGLSLFIPSLSLDLCLSSLHTLDRTDTPPRCG